MRLAEECIGAPQPAMILAHRPQSLQGAQTEPALAWLTSINISRCSRVTDAGVSALAELSTLEELDMSCCIHVNRAGFAAIATLPHLSSLTVARMVLSAGSLEAIGCMTGKQLEIACRRARRSSVWTCASSVADCNVKLLSQAVLSSASRHVVSYNAKLRQRQAGPKAAPKL